MPAKKVDPAKVLAFAKVIADGGTITAAQVQSGISHATAYRQLANPDSQINIAIADMGVAAGRIPGKNALNDNAQKGLEDFGFFRQHFFARSTSPWAEEAAYKIAELLETEQEEYLVINIAPGVGKALALDTPIATPTGWTTQGEIQIGDELFDENGKICRVTNKSEIFYDHDCYEVLTDDGAWVIANGAHEWSVRLGGHGQYGWKKIPEYAGKTGPKASPDGRHIHTTEFLAKRKGKRAQLQLSGGLDLPDALLPIDPYVLGVWLGDGHSALGRITCHPEDTEILDRVVSAGYTVEQKGYMLYSVTGSKKWTRDGLTSDLRKAGLLNNKRIPSEYLRASSRQRLALLQGLIDTDGSVNENGMIEFCNTNPNLAFGVQELAISLGVKTSIAESRAMLYGKDCGPRWRVTFYLQNAAYLTRKRERTRNGVRTPSRYLTVTKVDSVPTQCIEVDSPSHLYLAGRGLLVTHNSTMFTHDLPAWILARDRSRSVMIGSATQNLAEGYVNRLRRSFERTIPERADRKLEELGLAQDAKSTLSRTYGRFRPMQGTWAKGMFDIEQEEGQARGEKEYSVAAFGMDAGFLGGRYHLVIWDDLVTKATVRTEQAREKLIGDWDTQSETRLEPEGLLILQGQRIGPNDLYRYALDQREYQEIEMTSPDEVAPKKYHHIAFKAHYDEKCTGDHSREAQAWPDGCLLDPRRLNFRKLMNTKLKDEGLYRTVYQQEDIAIGNTLVNPIWISGGLDPETQIFHQGCWDVERRIGSVKDFKGISGYSVVTVDPSPTKFWAVMWWFYEPERQFFHLIDMVRQPMEAPDFLDYNIQGRRYSGLLEEWVARSKELGLPITNLIMESNAAQKFMNQYNYWKNWSAVNSIDITPHQTNSSNKSHEEYGVQTISPHFRHGRVRLPGDLLSGSRHAVNQFVKEVTEYPSGMTDDTVMSFWFLVWQAPNLFDSMNVPVYKMERPSFMAGRGERVGTR